MVPTPSGEGAEVGNIEPNNTIEEAGNIVFGEPFPATIHPVKDHDWYKADVKEQGYIKVQANNVPDNLKLEVAFALYEEWEGKKEKRLRNWHRLPDALPVSEPGTYYFVIHDDYDDQSSEEPFQLKVDFLEEFDFHEPNNTAEEAKVIEPGTEIELAIFPVGDEDWFKVTAPGQGYLAVSTKDVPGGIKPEVRFGLYDEWANPKLNVLQNWRKLPAACFIPEAGEYYLTIIDDYNDAFSETTFKIKVDYLEEMDIYEPNDKFTDAKEIKRGDTLHVAIFPTGDQDYFKINSGKKKELAFLTKGVPRGIKAEMRLYTIDPNDMDKLKAYSKWEKLPVKFDVEENRDYYVLLIDDYNDASSREVFMIRVQ